MKFVFATGNKGKLREAQEILGPGFEILTPKDFGINDDIAETGDTLIENSLIKARFIWDRLHVPCFADDTGLEVDALGGAPGVHTARYAAMVAEEEGRSSEGADHNFSANMDTLLAKLSQKGESATRRARFHSVVTLITPDGEVHCFDGVLDGCIAMQKAGCGGFGYDPVFIADEYPDRTVAEIPEEAKNEISHRGKALRAMASYLKEGSGNE